MTVLSVDSRLGTTALCHVQHEQLATKKQINKIKTEEMPLRRAKVTILLDAFSMKFRRTTRSAQCATLKYNRSEKKRTTEHSSSSQHRYSSHRAFHSPQVDTDEARDTDGLQMYTTFARIAHISTRSVSALRILLVFKIPSESTVVVRVSRLRILEKESAKNKPIPAEFGDRQLIGCVLRFVNQRGLP